MICALCIHQNYSSTKSRFSSLCRKKPRMTSCVIIDNSTSPTKNRFLPKNRILILLRVTKCPKMTFL